MLETLRETKTLAQVSFTANKRVAAENQIHPTLLSKWRTEALSAFPYLFERGAKNAEKSDAQQQRIEQLYQEVGPLTLQVNWLEKNPVSNLTRSERLALVERNANSELSLSLQSALLGLSRANLSKAAQGQDHKVFPYLLRGLLIERPNQVWGVDITYLRLTAGWMYLVAFAALLRIA